MVVMLEGGRNFQVRPGGGSLDHWGYALEVMIGSQSLLLPLLPCPKVDDLLCKAFLHARCSNRRPKSKVS